MSCKEKETPNDHRTAITGELLIIHAGSLAVPFREISSLFNEKYPDVTIKAQSAGSRDCARKISDLGQPCDVMGSADEAVVKTLLMPDHTKFNIRFATNEMVLAYTARSKMSQEINSSNWYQLILHEQVNLGRADPNRDPCGYRTVMLFQLAEKYYGVSGLAQKLEEKANERFIRPKETDLLALLESGEIDYL